MVFVLQYLVRADNLLLMGKIKGKDKGKIRGIRKIGKINTYSVSCYFKNFWDLQHAKN